MILFYSFNEDDDQNFYDLSGNGRNGTWNDVSIANGEVGKAASFDGSNDYGQSGTGYLDGLSEFTLYAKLIPRDSDGTAIHSNGQLKLYFDASTTNIKCDVTTVNGSVTLSVSVTHGTWWKVFVHYDGSNVTLYVPGASASPQSAALTGSVAAATQELTIGAADTGSIGEHFQGNIEEVRIYDQALGSDARQALIDTNCGIRHPVVGGSVFALGDIVKSGAQVGVVALREEGTYQDNMRVVPLTDGEPSVSWVRVGHITYTNKQSRITMEEIDGIPEIRAYDGINDSSIDDASKLQMKLSGKDVVLHNQTRELFFQCTNNNYEGYEADMLDIGDNVDLTIYNPVPFTQLNNCWLIVTSAASQTAQITVDTSHHVPEGSLTATQDTTIIEVSFTADETKKVDISSVVGDREGEMTGLDITTDVNGLHALGCILNYET